MNYYVGIFRRCEASYMRSKMERYGLLPLESKLLVLLRDSLCSQEELALRLNLDKGRIAKAISNLEGKKLITRQTNETNKRQKIVSLTAEGTAMLTKIDEIFAEWDTICYSGFTEEEKQLHQGFLKRIADNAVKYRCRKEVEKHD